MFALQMERRRAEEATADYRHIRHGRFKAMGSDLVIWTNGRLDLAALD